MGRGGVKSLGKLAINAGTLRIAKGAVTDALALASVINVGSNGDVKVEYAGLTSSTLSNNVTVDTSVAARTLTLSAGSGVLAAQGSTFTLGGLIVKSGANAVTIWAEADTALDDWVNKLER